MTNRGWILLTIGLAFLLLALLSGASLFYDLVVIFFAYFLISRWTLKRNVKDFYHFFDVDELTAEVGEPLSLHFKFSNLGWLPITRVQVEFEATEGLRQLDASLETHNLRPYGSVSSQKALPLERRGHFTVGRVRVRFADPLGTQVMQKYYHKGIALTVTPRTLNLLNEHWIPLTTASEGPVESWGREGHSQDGLRPYQQGEPLRWIQWKQFAKRRMLLVAEKSAEKDALVTILVHGQTGGDVSQEELLIAFAWTMVRYCFRRQIIPRLVVADQLIQSPDENVYRQVLTHMDFTVNAWVVNRSIAPLNRESWVVIITNDPSFTKYQAPPAHYTLVTDDPKASLWKHTRILTMMGGGGDVRIDRFHHDSYRDPS